jgi:hopanoid biosynthesis associated protein HpnK
VKHLIVTGDDFGLSLPVNQAIEQAHREGILNTTSLMVGAPAAADAVNRARKLPGLKVGLHLAVARCRPTSSPHLVKDLLDENGDLSPDLVRAGFRFFFMPGARKQLATEIRAQFEAFRVTGLPLDHVNAHNHMHLHPTVFRLLLDIGKEYGLRAVRIPYEPFLLAWRATHDRLISRLCTWMFLAPWILLMKWRLRKAHINCNDYLFGLSDSSKMTRDTVLRFLKQVPEGVTEIYFHPAVGDLPGERPHDDPAACAMELDTLLCRELQREMDRQNIKLVSFSEIAMQHP